MAIPGDHGHIDAHNYWLQFIDDVTNHKIYPGPAGPAGPAGANGPAGPLGPKGDQGQGIALKGYYDTYEQFIAAHPKGNAGDAFIVGKNLYVWDVTDNNWQDCGPSVGPQGPKGDVGSQGPAGATGPAGAKGDTGLQGPTGKDGGVGPAGKDGTVGPAGKDGVAAATTPLTYNADTHTVGVDQTALNTTLDTRYAQTTALTVKANLSGAVFTGGVSVVSPVAPVGAGVRQTFISTVVPTDTDGKDGDVWMVYKP